MKTSILGQDAFIAPSAQGYSQHFKYILTLGVQVKKSHYVYLFLLNCTEVSTEVLSSLPEKAEMTEPCVLHFSSYFLFNLLFGPDFCVNVMYKL